MPVNIVYEVDRLVRRHNTRNPLTIAKYEGFHVKYSDYDNIKGYYYNILKRKFIVINRNLDEFSRTIVCAHELGHGILHNIDNTYFIKDYTLFPEYTKVEREANKFAAELIISDDMDESQYYKDGVSLGNDVFAKLMKLKFNIN